MRTLIPKHDSVPAEIQAIKVRSRVVLYYQLPDLDWLLVFTRTDQDHQLRARNSMNGADPEIINQILKGELGEPNWIWPYVGLRDGVLLITRENPKEEDEAMAVEAAQMLSQDQFGIQRDAPTLKADPRTGKLQEVVVDPPPIQPQEAAPPVEEPTKPESEAESTQEPKPEG